NSIPMVFEKEDDIMKYRTIFRLYVKTGMRRNELLDLNVDDIDIVKGKIIVRKTKNRDVKVIEMDNDIKKMLSEYLNHFKYESGDLFRDRRRGKKIYRETLSYVFKKIKAKANLPREFKVHSFRRYFINTLRRNGVDLVIIQRLAGHRKIGTTEGYCNIAKEEKIKAIETIKVK
ncbi:unnamed protein product, partial [marine sediment metagenome]